MEIALPRKAAMAEVADRRLVSAGVLRGTRRVIARSGYGAGE